MLDSVKFAVYGAKGKLEGCSVEVQTPDSADDIMLGVSFDHEDMHYTYMSREEARDVAIALLKAAQE